MSLRRWRLSLKNRLQQRRAGTFLAFYFFSIRSTILFENLYAQVDRLLKATNMTQSANASRTCFLQCQVRVHQCFKVVTHYLSSTKRANWKHTKSNFDMLTFDAFRSHHTPCSPSLAENSRQKCPVANVNVVHKDSLRCFFLITEKKFIWCVYRVLDIGNGNVSIKPKSAVVSHTLIQRFKSSSSMA